MASRQAGFSLLEVLVAFSVLALMLGVLMQTLSQSSRNVAISTAYSKALTLAESKLAEAGAYGPLDAATYGDALEGEFEWEITASPIATAPAGSSGLLPYHVRVVVAWGTEAQRRSVELDTIKLARGS